MSSKLSSKEMIEKKIIINKKTNESLVMRRRVMNNDILYEIFDNFSVNQLLRIERVSKQFGECVKEVLKTRKGLRIGPKIENYLCEDLNHSIISGNISQSIIRRNDCLSLYDLTHDKSKRYLTPILKKCSNIKSLFLSQCIIDSEVIQLIIENSKQLKCLSFISINGLNEEMNCRSVLDLLNDRITHLAIDFRVDYDFRSQGFYYYLFQTSVEVLITNGSLDLRKFLSSFPQTIRSLNLLNCKSNQELNEKSVLALVQNNAKLIKDLNIENYFISPQNFDLILENLNLSRLSVKFFSNRSLPMSSIQKMIEFQKSLTHLKLINCELKVDSNYGPIVGTLNISSLELKNCLLKPNVFQEFVKLLKNLEILITNQFICCECYNPFGNECDICYEKCVKDMKKLKNIQVLRLKSCQIRPQFVESLVNFANLETIEVIDVYSQRNYCLSKRLIEVCVEIAKRDSNKLIKLKLIDVKDYAIDISIPKNLQFIYV
jgi:hypothetical protein